MSAGIAQPRKNLCVCFSSLLLICYCTFIELIAFEFIKALNWIVVWFCWDNF